MLLPPRQIKHLTGHHLAGDSRKGDRHFPFQTLNRDFSIDLVSWPFFLGRENKAYDFEMGRFHQGSSLSLAKALLEGEQINNLPG
jgi:hypothetical protein